MTDNNIRYITEAFEEYNGKVGRHALIFKCEEPMRLHTTFKIGGNAALYVTADSPEALSYAVKTINLTGTRSFVLGRGSNVLFDDSGFDGVVVSLTGMNTICFENGVIHAMAGATMSEVAKCARDNSVSGFEFLYGIPGSVGGGVFMNAGAYGGEMAHVLISSTYLDASDGTLHTISLSEHDYGYRKSVYRNHPERIVISAEFRGVLGNKNEISALMSDLMARRRTKQPLEFPSAGSVFKRCAGHFTGQLIEEAGLKGTSVGGAEISEKHAGFIINKGGATCADVLGLIEIVKSRIREKDGLELETEVIYIK